MANTTELAGIAYETEMMAVLYVRHLLGLWGNSVDHYPTFVILVCSRFDAARMLVFASFFPLCGKNLPAFALESAGILPR